MLCCSPWGMESHDRVPDCVDVAKCKADSSLLPSQIPAVLFPPAQQVISLCCGYALLGENIRAWRLPDFAHEPERPVLSVFLLARRCLAPSPFGNRSLASGQIAALSKAPGRLLRARPQSSKNLPFLSGPNALPGLEGGHRYGGGRRLRLRTRAKCRGNQGLGAKGERRIRSPGVACSGQSKRFHAS
jgi:hypothetical protein